MSLVKRYIFILMMALVALCNAAAQTAVGNDEAEAEQSADDSLLVEDRPDIKISLLTCSPGEELYTKFGHTAIRVLCEERGYDVVFNYGCFDYNADNFVFKFVLGKTDYLLAAEPMTSFMMRYRDMGVGVHEQVIDLTSSEAHVLFDSLLVNLQPQNQQYRYNWLYDNCTERACNIIDKCISGQVVYEREHDANITVRGILHLILQDSPWTDFGISLILGSEIDLPTSRSLQMFIPDIYRQQLSQARVSHVNNYHNAVKEEKVLLKPTLQASPPGVLTPNVVFGLLLLAALYISYREWKTKRQVVWFDIALTTLQGLMGCIIAFLYFFSEHPSVNSNWLVVVFNPIPLFYAGWMYYCSKKNKKNLLSIANLTALSAYLPTMYLCMQTFYLATYMLVFTLWIRSVMQMKLCRFAFTSRAAKEI